LYIPLGGNRGSRFAESRNLMVTMLLGGLWHGASWRFVIWGGLHGTFLLAERGVRSVFAGTRFSSTLPARLVAAAVTFGLVLVTWAYFRAGDLAGANRIALAMFGLTAERATILDPIHYLGTFAVVGGLLVAHWAMRDTTLEQAASRIPWFVLAPTGAALATALILIPGDSRAFIYFQF
jgi:alginate O-acetyltransferase complex protein AlgI